MNKTIDFGKIDFNNCGRKINKVTIELSLIEKKEGVEFSCSGAVWNESETDNIVGGQCLGMLLPFFKDDNIFKTIYRWWKSYHLNGLHAGTKAQERALKDSKWGGVNANYYNEQCAYLDSIGMLYDNGYKFGCGWLLEPIPDDVLAEMKKLIGGVE